MNTLTLLERIRELSNPMDPIVTGMEPRLPEMRGIRAVVFDIYGTLLLSDSGDIESTGGGSKASRFREAWDAAGIGTLPEGCSLWECYLDTIARFHTTEKRAGNRYPEVDIRRVWQEILGLLGWQLALDDPDLLRLAIEVEVRSNPVWPMPGAFEVIQKIRETGRWIGIISNAQFYTPLVLEAFAGTSLSEMGITEAACQWSWEHGIGKPSVGLYEQSRDYWESQHGLCPQEILFVGNDMLKDIMPAVKVGFRTALFAGDQRSLKLRLDDERCQGVSPDSVITTLADLLSMLR
jgi:putative hydrolase of the HAD superfamily